MNAAVLEYKQHVVNYVTLDIVYVLIFKATR